MKVSVAPGKYVIAVSGGVDSMVLLDLLTKNKKLELIVAHFNHGIRPKARNDERFVAEKARRLGLVFEAGYGFLGPEASEATARQARYEFLDDIKQKHEADAVITAHHQDDLIETAVINIMRGTGPKGLVPMLANSKILRPMLLVRKNQIINYAKRKKIEWVEDETNTQLNYLRNYVRRAVLGNLKEEERQVILGNIWKIESRRAEKEEITANLSQYLVHNETSLNRVAFSSLPHAVAKETLIHWLRGLGVKDLDRPTVERLTISIKTARPNTTHIVNNRSLISVSSLEARFNNT